MRSQKITRRELVEYYRPDLTGKRWQLRGSLHFRRKNIPLWMAEYRFDDWIGRYIEDGDDDCQWFRVSEHGAFPHRPFFHVLVRGLRFESKYYVMLAFDELCGGDAELEYCSSGSNISTFINNIARGGSEFDVAYELD
jgi:hypothetical protein